MWDTISENDKARLSKLSSSIQQMEELSEDLIRFENNFIQKIRISNPEIFDQIKIENNNKFKNTLDFIIRKYNICIENHDDIIQTFDKISLIATAKNVKYNSVFSELGKKLGSGEAPSIKQIFSKIQKSCSEYSRNMSSLFQYRSEAIFRLAQFPQESEAVWHHFVVVPFALL